MKSWLALTRHFEEGIKFLGYGTLTVRLDRHFHRFRILPSQSSSFIIHLWTSTCLDHVSDACIVANPWPPTVLFAKYSIHRTLLHYRSQMHPGICLVRPSPRLLAAVSHTNPNNFTSGVSSSASKQSRLKKRTPLSLDQVYTYHSHLYFCKRRSNLTSKHSSSNDNASFPCGARSFVPCTVSSSRHPYIKRISEWGLWLMFRRDSSVINPGGIAQLRARGV